MRPLESAPVVRRAAVRSAPTVSLRLTVTAGGIVAAGVRVASVSRHLSKSTLALQRHAQRLIEARRGNEGKPVPAKSVTSHQEVSKSTETSTNFTGEQLLFVHFIPPSLRKQGKEKIPWIVHSTGSPVTCREALHVRFHSVRNFETFEGVASGARCQCAIAQHHLRGIGCLRWEDGVAIIESTEVAVLQHAETQTLSASTQAMETQTSLPPAAVMVQTQTDFMVETCCHEAQTEETAESRAAEEEASKARARLDCAREASMSAALKEAKQTAQTAEVALREAQRCAESREVEHGAVVESLHARIAALEASCRRQHAMSMAMTALGGNSSSTKDGTSRAMLLKLVSQRLLKAEATIGELRTRGVCAGWAE